MLSVWIVAIKAYIGFTKILFCTVENIIYIFKFVLSRNKIEYIYFFFFNKKINKTVRTIKSNLFEYQSSMQL
jgi:hypothetical protein